jgi:hypothetical protein
MIMLKKSVIVVSVLIMSILALSACNLPEKQISQDATPTSTLAILADATPTPLSVCENQYFPSRSGNTWEYSGSNSATGDYNRVDTVTQSSGEVFSVDTAISGITYRVDYSCSSAGLTVNNPIQQYVGALLSGPNAL